MKRFDRTDANQRRGDTVRIALILGSAIILLAIAQGCGERESPAGATLTAADSPQYIYSPQASSFFSLTAFRPKVDGSGQNDLVASFSWESRIGGYDLGMKAFQLDVAAKIHFFLDTEPPRWLNPHVSDFIEPQDMSPKTAKALGLVADAVRPLADDNGHSRPKFYLPGAGDHWRGPELDGRCSDLVRKFASGAITCAESAASAIEQKTAPPREDCEQVVRAGYVVKQYLQTCHYDVDDFNSQLCFNDPEARAFLGWQPGKNCVLTEAERRAQQR
jgi:hypothetical protein